MIERGARYPHAIEKDMPDPAYRVLILQKEIAGVGYRIARSVRTPQDSRFYMADIRTELGDAMVQCQMLALDLGFSPEEVLREGLRHTEERFKEFWPEGKC